MTLDEINLPDNSLSLLNFKIPLHFAYSISQGHTMPTFNNELLIKTLISSRLFNTDSSRVSFHIFTLFLYKSCDLVKSHSHFLNSFKAMSNVEPPLLLFCQIFICFRYFFKFFFHFFYKFTISTYMSIGMIL